MLIRRQAELFQHYHVPLGARVPHHMQQSSSSWQHEVFPQELHEFLKKINQYEMKHEPIQSIVTK